MSTLPLLSAPPVGALTDGETALLRAWAEEYARAALAQIAPHPLMPTAFAVHIEREVSDNGGPAFPVIELDHATGGVCQQHLGVRLRDSLAGQAMQGFAADPNKEWPDGLDGMARAAYRWAAAMLKARAL